MNRPLLICLCACLGACASGPAAPKDEPPPLESSPSAAPPADAGAPGPAEGPTARPGDVTGPIAWQWDDAPDLYPLVDLVLGDVALSQAPGRSSQPVMLERTGATRWQTKVTDDGFISGAAMARDATRVYVASYSRIASGCRLAAYALADGAELWAVRAEGIGPIGHSKYSNRVQLRLIDGHPVLFGSEAGGRYVEARDAATGAERSNAKLPAQLFAHPLGEALFYELDNMLTRQASYEVELADFLRRHVLAVPADEPSLRAPFDRAVAQLAGLPVGGQQYRLELTVARAPSGRLIVRAKRR